MFVLILGEYLSEQSESKTNKRLYTFVTNGRQSPRALPLSPEYFTVTIRYIISSLMHAFLVVLAYDPVEDRHIADVIKRAFNSLSTNFDILKFSPNGKASFRGSGE